jgi:predicted glycosyltransferase involved in capsule biosynthesis
MIDSEITFIIHLRADSEERKKNVDIAISYYTAIAPNSKFIIVEDDIVKNFEYLGDIKNIQYIHTINSGTYNKCKSYNIGLQHATTDIVCFLDIDCIVSDINLSKSIEIAYKNNCINIAYNGVAIYLDYTAKSQIGIKADRQIYDYFESLVDRSNLYNEFKTEYYTVGNVKAVGGCLMGKREIFKQINGFNPNFIGWGYEDNEITLRARILNIPLNYINTPKSFLFHLPHEKDQKNDKSVHDFYRHNYEEISKVMAMTKETLEQYIKTW